MTMLLNPLKLIMWWTGQCKAQGLMPSAASGGGEDGGTVSGSVMDMELQVDETGN